MDLVGDIFNKQNIDQIRQTDTCRAAIFSMKYIFNI